MRRLSGVYEAFSVAGLGFRVWGLAGVESHEARAAAVRRLWDVYEAFMRCV